MLGQQTNSTSHQRQTARPAGTFGELGTSKNIAVKAATLRAAALGGVVAAIDVRGDYSALTGHRN